MTLSEQRAIRWLQSGGITQRIKIRRGTSPDIVLENGEKYEIKKTTANGNTIILTLGQSKIFSRSSDIKFIVFHRKQKPQLIKNFLELKKRFHVITGICVSVWMSPSLIKKIDKLRGAVKRSTFIVMKLEEALK